MLKKGSIGSARERRQEWFSLWEIAIKDRQPLDARNLRDRCRHKSFVTRKRKEKENRREENTMKDNNSNSLEENMKENISVTFPAPTQTKQ